MPHSMMIECSVKRLCLSVMLTVLLFTFTTMDRGLIITLFSRAFKANEHTSFKEMHPSAHTHPQRIFYNRVPKTGSTTLKYLARFLKKKNKFQLR